MVLVLGAATVLGPWEVFMMVYDAPVGCWKLMRRRGGSV
jgi:hypothetical protein